MKSEWPKRIRANNSPSAPAVTVYRAAHPRNKSGFLFTVYWTDGSGPHRERFANEAKALQEAKLKAEQLYQGDLAAAGMSKADREELDAMRRLTYPTPPLAALREWVRAHDLTQGSIIAAAEDWANAHGTAKLKQITVADAVKAYCEIKTKAKKNVAVDHASRWKRIKEDLGTLPLAGVSEERLTSFLGQWDHASTVITFRKRLVSVWRWAKRRGYLPRNQITAAELTEPPADTGSKIGIITPGALQRILEWTRKEYPEHLAAIVLMSLCGMRAKEVRWQMWEDIHLDHPSGAHLAVSKAKRNTPSNRIVHLLPSAVEWLMLCPTKQGCVTPIGPKKEPILINDIMRMHIREAGIVSDLSRNCFRHSFISYYLAWKQNVPATAIEAGNSDKIIHRNYKQPVPQEMGRAWFEDVRPSPAPLSLEEILAIKTA